MKSIFSIQDVDSIQGQIDRFDGISYLTLRDFLKKHKLEEEYYRLEENRHIGVSKQRILTRTCLDFLDGSWPRLIAFYEKCNRKKHEPRYEDLTTTLLLSFLAAYLASIASEITKTSGPALGRWIREKLKKEPNKETNVKNVFHKPVTYVTDGTILREQYRKSQDDEVWQLYIGEDEYMILLDEFRKELYGNSISILIDGENVLSEEANDKFNKYREFYLSEHGFTTGNTVDEIFDELIHLAIRMLEEQREEEIR